MSDMIMEINGDDFKRLLTKLVKNNSSNFISFLFNSSTKIIFENDSISVKFLMFKYFVKLIQTPYYISGTYKFQHNIPLSRFNLEKIPENIKIYENELYVFIPENIITKNIIIKNIKIENNLIKLNLIS
ncbi:MAG TPA: hypothetical protein PLS66_04950 [Tepiditoga sp.]|nr:hypothetical protein [Tepiditoga sp.]